MSEKEFDLEKEVHRVSRNSRVHMMRTEQRFDNQIKDLEKLAEDSIKSQIKDFDDSKELTSQYLEFENDSTVIDMYRDRLKRI